MQQINILTYLHAFICQFAKQYPNSLMKNTSIYLKGEMCADSPPSGLCLHFARCHDYLLQPDTCQPLTALSCFLYLISST
jgi:hypothetical protein